MVIIYVVIVQILRKVRYMDTKLIIKTYEDLLIAKGIMDSEWNILSTGEDLEKNWPHLYWLQGNRNFNLVIICCMLICMGRCGFVKKLEDYEYSVSGKWFKINGLKEGVADSLRVSMDLMRELFKYNNYDDDVFLKQLMDRKVYE